MYIYQTHLFFLFQVVIELTDYASLDNVAFWLMSVVRRSLPWLLEKKKKERKAKSIPDVPMPDAYITDNNKRDNGLIGHVTMMP